MPIAPNKIDVVRAVMLQHPEIDRRAEGPFAPQRGGITQLVVQALGGYPWGRKSRDRSATNLSDDALCYRLPDGSFEIYDTISGADGSATWDYAGTFRDGENGYFSTVPVAPQPTPQPPAPTPQPQPQPAPAIECDCAEKLDAALEPLENILQALTIAVADIHSQLKRGFNGSARLGTTMRFDITPKG